MTVEPVRFEKSTVEPSGFLFRDDVANHDTKKMTGARHRNLPKRPFDDQSTMREPFNVNICVVVIPTILATKVTELEPHGHWVDIPEWTPVATSNVIFLDWRAKSGHRRGGRALRCHVDAEALALHDAESV